MICKHKFIYGGVKYHISNEKLPGSGAQYVFYFDWFYCEKCLEYEYRRLKEYTNTYQELAYNATPKEI